VALVIAGVAVLVIFGGRRRAGSADINNQSVGWNVANDIKQAASSATPHEPEL
jgi:hypothetical protein